MRPLHLLLAGCAAVLLAGCGGEGTRAGDLSRSDVYKAKVGAQCSDATSQRKDLSFPEVGDSAALARYLAEVIDIQDQHRQAIQSIDPPPGVDSVRSQGLKYDVNLTSILAGYMRAARGGRDFQMVVEQLQTELNPVIRRANAFFERNGVDGCRQDTLDFKL